MESADRDKLVKVVRAVGIEPTLLAEPDFESGASTSSTTPASGSILYVIPPRVIVRHPNGRANPSQV